MHTSITIYNAYCIKILHSAFISVREISASLCKLFVLKIYTQPLRKCMLTEPCMNIYMYSQCGQNCALVT